MSRFWLLSHSPREDLGDFTKEIAGGRALIMKEEDNSFFMWKYNKELRKHGWSAVLTGRQMMEHEFQTVEEISEEYIAMLMFSHKFEESVR